MDQIWISKEVKKPIQRLDTTGPDQLWRVYPDKRV